MKRLMILVLCAFTLVPAAMAQEVTDDEVNRIAKRMYCPVCENIPLDTCGTAACADWRYEIRLMLEQGFTEEQIRTDFVDRFGDRVVGTPQNPVLRALSLVTPWLLAAAALFVGLLTFRRWGQNAASAAPVARSEPTDDYRALLERDLKGDLS